MPTAREQTDALVAKLKIAASTGSMVTITCIEASVLVRVVEEWAKQMVVVPAKQKRRK